MSNANAMASLVGRMKVEELARLAGVGLEELVATVLAHGGGARAERAALDVSGPRPGPTEVPSRRGPGRGRAQAAAPQASVEPFPPLGEMVGRATYREIHFAIDRWLLGNVWEQEDHNVSRAAARLQISRRRYRELFSRIRRDDVGSTAEPLERRPDTSVLGPELEPMLPTGTYRMIHDEADRWLLAHVLEWAGGNLTHAARHLDVSRKHLREHLARVGIR